MNTHPISLEEIREIELKVRTMRSEVMVSMCKAAVKSIASVPAKLSSLVTGQRHA